MVEGKLKEANTHGWLGGAEVPEVTLTLTKGTVSGQEGANGER
jgi:hypothetical protein